MPAAKPCWDVLFCMIFYEWNGKLFDRTISVPGTDNQELVNLVTAGNRDDKIINGIKADTRAVIFRLGQEYHIDLFDRQRQIISGHAACHWLYELVSTCAFGAAISSSGELSVAYNSMIDCGSSAAPGLAQ